MLVTSLKLHTHKPYAYANVHSCDHIVKIQTTTYTQWRLTLKCLALGQTERILPYRLYSTFWRCMTLLPVIQQEFSRYSIAWQSKVHFFPLPGIHLGGRRLCQMEDKWDCCCLPKGWADWFEDNANTPLILNDINCKMHYWFNNNFRKI